MKRSFDKPYVCYAIIAIAGTGYGGHGQAVKCYSPPINTLFSSRSDNVMAFIALPNGIKIACEYALNGQLVVNVYHVTTSLPITTVNLTALATVFLNWWTNNQRQNFTTAIGLNRIVVTDVSVPNGLQTIMAVAPAVAGTVAGATAPNNVALVLSQRTGFSGRSFRGRSYYAGVGAAEIADNFISTTFASALTADAASLTSQLNSAGFIWVVASFFTGGAPRATGVATPINSFIADTRVDTQRRRLPGTGE